MDDTKLIQSASGLVGDLLSRHGIEGLIGLWLIYEKWIAPWRKKGSEEWISWRDVKAVRQKVDEMENRVNGHLSEAQAELVKVARVEVKVENQGKEIDEVKENIQDIFKLLSEIKNMMIERNNH